MFVQTLPLPAWSLLLVSAVLDNVVFDLSRERRIAMLPVHHLQLLVLTNHDPHLQYWHGKYLKYVLFRP